MKTQRFLAITAMTATLGVAMTACDKDNKKDSPFAGTYSNVYLLAISPDGKSVMAYDTVDVTISGKEGENLTLSCNTTLNVSQDMQVPLNLNLALSSITPNPSNANQAGFRIGEHALDVTAGQLTIPLKIKGSGEYPTPVAAVPAYDGGLTIVQVDGVGAIKGIDFKAKADAKMPGAEEYSPITNFIVSSVIDTIAKHQPSQGGGQ